VARAAHGPSWTTAGLSAIVLLLAGCRGRPARIAPQPAPASRLLPAEADARAEIVRRDPVAYLHRVAFICQGLDQYTLLFTRSERRGLFRQLYGPEHIRCWFRRRPFSVHMQFLDPDSKYAASVYVEGQANNQVRFVTRRWMVGLLPPPEANRVDLLAPVTWGESKRPLTEFGLERLVQRTLDSLHAAGEDALLTYKGLLNLPDAGATVHHLHLEYPARRYRAPIQELYIDVATDLPVGTAFELPSGQIDASYFYTEINTHVRLTDADFLLDAERGPTSRPHPAARPR
jgi:hypothetical protein